MRRPRTRPYTYQSLRKSAEYYVWRYPASSAKLKQVLTRRIDRVVAQDLMTWEEATPLLDQVLSDLTRDGLLNDAGYATAKATSLHRKGWPLRRIANKLKQDGLEEEQINTALAEVSSPDVDHDLAAALKILKKKRAGLFRTTPASDPAQVAQKDLALLARQGFSYTVAQSALSFDDQEEAEALLLEADLL